MNDPNSPPREDPSVPARRRTFVEFIAALLFGAEGSDTGRSVLRLLAFVWGMVGLGLLSLLVPAISQAIQGDFTQALAIVTVGLFIAGAATAFGSLLGFLFGIPKASPSHAPNEVPNPSHEPAYVPNTNLENISDWLTKVIVGVGLVQIREVIGWIVHMGQVAGAAMGDTELMRVIATSFLIHNLLMGFFQGFLVAYVYLPKVFALARKSVEAVDA